MSSESNQDFDDIERQETKDPECKECKDLKSECRELEKELKEAERECDEWHDKFEGLLESIEKGEKMVLTEGDNSKSREETITKLRKELAAEQQAHLSASKEKNTARDLLDGYTMVFRNEQEKKINDLWAKDDIIRKLRIQGQHDECTIDNLSKTITNLKRRIGYNVY